MAALGLWTLNHPQVVGTCPGHGPQLIELKIDLPKVLGLKPPSPLSLLIRGVVFTNITLKPPNSSPLFVVI